MKLLDVTDVNSKRYFVNINRIDYVDEVSHPDYKFHCARMNLISGLQIIIPYCLQQVIKNICILQNERS